MDSCVIQSCDLVQMIEAAGFGGAKDTVQVQKVAFNGDRSCLVVTVKVDRVWCVLDGGFDDSYLAVFTYRFDGSVALGASADDMLGVLVDVGYEEERLKEDRFCYVGLPSGWDVVNEDGELMTDVGVSWLLRREFPGFSCGVEGEGESVLRVAVDLRLRSGLHRVYRVCGGRVDVDGAVL